MKRGYLDTLSRHRLLLLPLVLAIVVGTGFAFTAKRQFVAQAAVWADAPIPQQSTVGTTGTDNGQSPPSAGQIAMMQDYLSSRTFLLKVARGYPVAAIPTSGSPEAVERGLALLAKSITTSAPGPNIMTISVKQPSAAAAQGIATSLVNEFLKEQKDVLVLRAMAQVSSARKQVGDASNALGAARTAQASYLREHPASPGVVDPQAETLRSNVTQAQQAYEDAQKAAQDALGSAPIIDDSSLFVMDEPAHALALGRRKALMLGFGGGLLIGLVITAVSLMLIIKRDDVIREQDDVESVLQLRVVGSIRTFPAGATSRESDPGGAAVPDQVKPRAREDRTTAMHSGGAL